MGGGGGWGGVPVLPAVAVAVTVTAQAGDSCAHRPPAPRLSSLLTTGTARTPGPVLGSDPLCLQTPHGLEMSPG